MNPMRRSLLFTLFLLAIVGAAVHLGVHPIFAAVKDQPGVKVFRGSFVAATVLPLLDVLLVTWLFAARRTAVYGHLLNGLIVVYGSVLMAHYGIAALPQADAPLSEWMFKSNIIDIALAWADFAAGKALYDSWMGAP